MRTPTVGPTSNAQPMNYGERIDDISARMDAAYAYRRLVWGRDGRDSPNARLADATIEAVYADLRALNTEMGANR